MSELPVGWVQVTLEDVAEINPRKSVDLELDETVTFVPMAAVSEVSGTIVGGVSRPLRDVNRGFTQFAEGDVIFAKITPSMENGKSAVAIGLANGIGFGSTEFHVFRSYGAILPQYLWRFVRQKTFREDAQKVMSGAVGQQRVPAEYLRAHPIPLPPLAEQKRIIAKIDSLTSRTAHARSYLDHIPTLVERYKTCLLERAFSGGVGTTSQNGNGSSSQKKILIGELVTNIVAGKNLRCEERPPEPDEKGVVKVSAVTWGKFDSLASKTLPPSFEPPEQSRIHNGDILISRANTLELVASVVIVEGCPDNLYLSDKVLRLEMPEEDKPWLMWFLRSPLGRKEIETRASGNQASMRNLSQKRLREIPIPWPSRRDREEIIRHIEAAFSWLERVSADHASSSNLLTELDAAILSKAFRGEFVTQKPNDEPAGVLLARVHDQREAAPKRLRRIRTKDNLMTKDAKARLLQDSRNWPDSGLPFEQVAKRIPLPYEDIRDAIFALLSDPNPSLRQVFDKNAECMHLQRIKT